MDLFNENINWKKELHPILEKYKDQKHPLDYKNIYQLLIMVILSAQDSDNNINKIANVFFTKFPDIESLAISNKTEISSYIQNVKYYKNKAEYIVEISKILKNNNNIPLSIKSLTSLKGIGRKSANVILREAKVPFEGIMTDLHVIRVAPRIGLIKTTKDGLKAEKELMQVLPREIWNDIGISISFLGREICRPIPKCFECPINSCCEYYKNTNY